MRIVAGLFLAMFCISGMFLPSAAVAATTISGDLIMVTPPTPEPNTTVTVGIVNSARVLPGSAVHWFVDDVERTDDVNSREITVQAGELGTVVKVRAEVRTPGQGTETASTTIAPVRVDLIVGANSHVPGFYRGRALPAGSSDISVRALVFGDDNGPYTYRWRVNGELHTGSVGQNNNHISFTPLLDSVMFVELGVYGRAGVLVAQKDLEIPLVEPEIHFYEANPLRGLLPNTLPNPYYFLNREITVRGEPYYFTNTPDMFNIDWRIDRQDVNANQDPLELTLVKTQEGGQAQVEMKIINTNGFLETAKRSLNITY